MKTKMIAIVALMTATMSGAAFAAESTQTIQPRHKAGAATQQVSPAAAQKGYAQLLAEYRKNKAAYDADPTVWTAEVPVKPTQPGEYQLSYRSDEEGD
jgi:hypothetical protein